MEDEAHKLLDSDETLEPYLQLAADAAANASNVSTIRTVVLKVLSDSKVFCGFDEIKGALQSRLAGAEGEPILRTLDLFSYGTFQDYVQAQQQQQQAGGGVGSVYLPLSDGQLFKLRQLTLLTLVQQACSNNSNSNSNSTTGTPAGGCLVPYHTVARELGFVTTQDNAAAVMDEAVLRQVEEVVLSCIYARVVAGQLCQKTAALVVSSRHGPPCRPRDVPLTNGAMLLATLQRFHGSRLDQARQRQQVRQQAVQTKVDANRQYHVSVQERKKKAESTAGQNSNILGGSGSRGGGGGGWGADGNGPPQERRMSDLGNSSSSRRQPKRSRAGGVSGGFSEQFRY